MLRNGIFRAEKVEYPNGVGCSIWRVFPNCEDEDIGICWDFAADELDDIIALLERLKDEPARMYEGE